MQNVGQPIWSKLHPVFLTATDEAKREPPG
jgi:hypothetical protein